MKLIAFVVALRYTFQLLFLLIVSKVKSFAFVKSKEHTDILMGVVDGIVALEVEKTSGTAHRTNWWHEGNSFATVVNGTGGAGFDCEIGLLSMD